MVFLQSNQEYDKLECWTSVGWMLWSSWSSWSSGSGKSTEDSIFPVQELGQQMEYRTEGHLKDLECMTLSLFHQQPGAIQKLEQWMEQWSKQHQKDVPKPFQQICEQAHLGAAEQGAL